MKVSEGFLSVRLAVLVCSVGILLFAMPRPASAQCCAVIVSSDILCLEIQADCDVQGYTVVLSSTDLSEMDAYTATVITPSLLSIGFEAFVFSEICRYPVEDTSVCTSIYTNEVWNDGSGRAQDDVIQPMSTGYAYYLWGFHYIPVPGDDNFLGITAAGMDNSPPRIDSISPIFDHLDTSGTMTVYGYDKYDPWTLEITAGFSSGTGVTITSATLNPDLSIDLGYTISPNASRGPRILFLQTRFGIGTCDQPFTVGDPTPFVSSISPDPWQASSSFSITIGGTGFGSNPLVTWTGPGVNITNISVNSSHTSISATATIAPATPDETVTVYVESRGYDGTGFVPAFDGQSATGSRNVLVNAISAPTPTLTYFGINVTNNSSNPKAVVVGQQIALLASVNLPSGLSISSKIWSTPDAPAIGGFSADLTYPYTEHLTPSPVTTEPSATSLLINFYWTSLGATGSSRSLSFSYMMNNGRQASASVSFNLAAPTNPDVDADTDGVHIVQGNPPEMYFGNPGSPAGISFEASADTPNGNAGGFSWVQLKNFDHISMREKDEPPYCRQATYASDDAPPHLDEQYPYSTGAFTADRPAMPLRSPDPSTGKPVGEMARNFSATMYLMWAPIPDNVCLNSGGDADACSIEVPLGTVAWYFKGDAVNTLSTSSGDSGTMWKLIYSSATQSPAPFQAGNSYPIWTQVTRKIDSSLTCHN